MNIRFMRVFSCLGESGRVRQSHVFGYLFGYVKTHIPKDGPIKDPTCPKSPNNYLTWQPARRSREMPPIACHLDKAFILLCCRPVSSSGWFDFARQKASAATGSSASIPTWAWQTPTR